MNKEKLKRDEMTEIYLHDLLLAVRTPYYVAVTPDIALIGRDTSDMEFEFGFARYWDLGTCSLSEVMVNIWHMGLDYIEANPEAVITVADGDDMYVFTFGDLPMLRVGAAN